MMYKSYIGCNPINRRNSKLNEKVTLKYITLKYLRQIGHEMNSHLQKNFLCK